MDAVGNMFARREGRDPARAPVLFGSHLDSQPTGGKFEGALGVKTEAPLELVNWTDEEGSRFGHSLLGRGAWAGVHPHAKAMALRDVDGVSVAEALDGIGHRGAEPARPFPADATFEPRIEQGPILEREGKRVGVVTGQDAHAGTTPPSARRDALVAASRVIARVDALMRERGEDGRGTVGFLQVRPNSCNVVPGEVRFSAEFRHPRTAEIEALAEIFPAESGRLAE